MNDGGVLTAISRGGELTDNTLETEGRTEVFQSVRVYTTEASARAARNARLALVRKMQEDLPEPLVDTLNE